MNSDLQQPARPPSRIPACGSWLLAILALQIACVGCATRGTAPLLVRQPSEWAPGRKSGQAIDLKLVTYNIWGLPAWMTGARSGRYQRIARELERLDPDIILLQEAWTARARESVPADNRWWMARAAGQRTFFQQCGLVTLSKFPIIGGEFYPFSHETFPDSIVNKGFLKVTLLLPDGRVINIWNVHLQDGKALKTRRLQIQELVTQVQAAADGQVADLVGGDFNCTPESAMFRELESALGPSVQDLSGVAPFLTWNRLVPKPPMGKDRLVPKTSAGKTLDYVFIRPRTAFERVEAVPCAAFTAPTLSQRLSDHLGVEAAVSLVPARNLAGAAASDRRRTPAAGPDSMFVGSK